MARNSMRKNIFREIRHSIGRYIAILAIVALGVGFFAGLKVTRKSMIQTGDAYINGECLMYDFRVVSSLGLTGDDVAAFAATSYASAAEGAVSTDFIYTDRNSASGVLQAHTITEKLNLLSLVAGRMPEKDSEILADARMFGADDIGQTVRISGDNDTGTADMFAFDEYTIVGTVNSVYYLNLERGTTKLAQGSVSGFVYLTAGGMKSEYYTEIFIRLAGDAGIFSDEYALAVDSVKPEADALLAERAQIRFDGIYSDAAGEIASAEKTYDDNLEDYNTAAAALEASRDKLRKSQDEYNESRSQLSALEASGLVSPEQLAGMKAQLDAAKALIDESARKIDDAATELAKSRTELDDAAEKIRSAKTELAELERPVTYTYTRDDNAGYSCYGSDSSIVEGIAKIFPLFFFLVAALVCVTTMTRMVEEQRTQIGTLKALGYSDFRIAGKYMVYSGSSAVIGCTVGFILGSKLFPLAIWTAYGMLYGFADILFVFDFRLAAISLAVSLLCSVGATLAAVGNEIRSMPATLMRPKAPQAGKRVLLERVGFIWRRMPFLHKVSTRNILRYKKRMFMMIFGIAGCTALVLTGFGIRDSIGNIASDQFGNIMIYDYTVMFTSDTDASYRKDFGANLPDGISEAVFAGQTTTTVTAGGSVKKVYLVASDDRRITDMVSLHRNGAAVEYPADGYGAVSEKLAGELGVSVGDEVTLNIDDTQRVTFTVSGIFENHVYRYVYITAATYENCTGEPCRYRLAFASADGTADLHRAAADLGQIDGVAGVTVTADLCDRVEKMMHSLNYIVWLVIACAGALALIVLYNLSNINITERTREIATIKVLGFFRRETNAYVFRENIVLTVAGTAVGLVLGVFLHRFVMSQIKIDMVSFNVDIYPQSYLYAAALTLFFAVAVDLVMRKRIDAVNMAESLKSTE